VTRAVLNCVGKIPELSDRLTSFVIEGNKISMSLIKNVGHGSSIQDLVGELSKICHQ
jgi:hypothetical protein